MLGAGAKVNTLVKEVITNTSGFERVQSDSAMDLSAQGAGEPGADFLGADLALAKPGKPGGAARPSSHRLVVQPHFPYDSGTSHGCKLCPANLCKVAVQHPCARCSDRPSLSMYLAACSASSLAMPRLAARPILPLQ